MDNFQKFPKQLNGSECKRFILSSSTTKFKAYFKIGFFRSLVMFSLGGGTQFIFRLSHLSTFQCSTKKNSQDRDLGRAKNRTIPRAQSSIRSKHTSSMVEYVQARSKQSSSTVEKHQFSRVFESKGKISFT